MHSFFLAAALATAAAQGTKPEPAGNTQAPADPGDDIGGWDLPEQSANLDFIIFNRTGRTIVELNISPRGEESWSGNLIHYPEVPDQERAAASFTRDVELCRWDIRVRFQNGDRRTWPAVNLCDTSRVDLDRAP